MHRPRAWRGAASLPAAALFASVLAAASLLASPLAALPDGDDAAPPARPKPLAKDHPLQKALVTITVDDLKDDEAWLASDDRKGRCAGEASCDEAAEWIADRFEEDGL